MDEKRAGDQAPRIGCVVTADRDRVTAILTLADAASPGPWEVSSYRWLVNSPEDVVAQLEHETDGPFVAASRDAVPWLARRLLEALNTIDKAKALHLYEQKWGGVCGECESRWPCPTWQALNGGNE